MVIPSRKSAPFQLPGQRSGQPLPQGPTRATSNDKITFASSYRVPIYTPMFLCGQSLTLVNDICRLNSKSIIVTATFHKNFVADQTLEFYQIKPIVHCFETKWESNMVHLL